MKQRVLCYRYSPQDTGFTVTALNVLDVLEKGGGGS